ncbi:MULTISPECIES: YggS family pyridoxal phosphate-dependent enzyme [unclassified Bacillus (in: firmicutes)]|uniref:YggS family pyridoxal phosphate-dependent enzyme n=1 Tax=unclassified Bacillus (in: firmicutes) TaxID=185979 RepID=UPI0008E41C44|nr:MULTISPECIES: YggS family pyridoxal phosphate-dependent enzyme [unclassified Bacillus (in: firmicutes)]SFA75245.1 hypothetical protein SAMN02799634_101506 [Bacillus sp. UNCCL13]SFQ65379.1 hypothetical protein SAMN04488577_0781 [Bacillus sp. cl95]
MDVVVKLETIQKQIHDSCMKVARNPDEVKIIGVTKYVSIERAAEALEAGIVHLGENRDEGLIEKWQVLQDKPVWHYIGSLQTRKVKNIINQVEYIHSLDRLSLAEEINKRANKKVKCLVQVNVSGEESKHGLAPVEVIRFIESIKSLENVYVVGLMTMAPFTDDEKTLRECFKKLAEIRSEVQALHLQNAPCTELSMGMSNDFNIAIEEGATMVRIGTALVGYDDEEV